MLSQFEFPAYKAAAPGVSSTSCEPAAIHLSTGEIGEAGGLSPPPRRVPAFALVTWNPPQHPIEALHQIALALPGAFLPSGSGDLATGRLQQVLPALEFGDVNS